MGMGRRIGRWTVAGLLLAMAAVSSAPSPHPGKIAVGGAFPNGYLGLLARNGLPRTVLSDQQLADPEVLADFPLVIVAGLNGAPGGTVEALRSYVRNGGEVLFDYGPPPSGILRPGMVAVQQNDDDPLQVSARSTSKLALVGDQSPLAGIDFDAIEAPRLFGFGFSPKLAEGAKYTVLAEFTATSSLQDGFGIGGPGGRPQGGFGRPGFGQPDGGGFGGGGFGAGGNRVLRQPNADAADQPRDAPAMALAAPAGADAVPVQGQGGMFPGPDDRPRQRPGQPGQPGQPGGQGGPGGPRQMRDTGPPAPAIVMEELGAGKWLHCGPAIGLANVFGGVGYDDLTLRLLSLVSDGRVQPQLEAEGVELKFGQTVADLRRSGQLDSPTAEAADDDDLVELRAGAGQRRPLPAGYTELEAAIGGDFTLQANRGNGPLVVVLGYWSADEQTVVEINGTRTKLTAVVAGQQDQQIGTPTAAVGGPVSIKLRGRTLSIQAGGRVMSQAVDLAAGAVGVMGQQGEAVYQPVEEPYFVDDFMRTDAYDGGWETDGGHWHTVAAEKVETTPNAFSLKAEPEGVATASQGQWFWDNYRFAVAARPERDGTRLGLDIYRQSNGDALRLEADVAKDGDLRLVALSNGQRKVLATSPGGLKAGQWYRLMLVADGTRITGYVDGALLLQATDATFAGGRFGLWTDGPAQFDDVRVAGAARRESQVVRLPKELPDSAGTIDVNSWAGMAEPWLPEPDEAGLFWRRGLFGNGVMFRYDGPTLPDGATLSLLSHTDGLSPTSGVSLTASRAGDQIDYTLANRGKVVVSTRLPAIDHMRLALTQRGAQVVAEAAASKLGEVSVPQAQHIGFQFKGWQPRISSFSVASSGVMDETFAQAPVRWWIGSGTWALTNRWSCSPEWSWLGGTSEDQAVIWTKETIRGNQVLDFYAGPKMSEASGQAAMGQDNGPQAGPFGGRRPGNLRDHFNSERVGDFNATICGNGVGAMSGYAVVIGSKQGGVRLYREGEQVAANLGYELFVHTDNPVLDFFRGHNRWYHIEVEKEGATVRVRIENQLVLTWTDPAPLEAGQAAIWTQDNGIMVPRVSVYEPAAGLPATEL